MEEITNKETGPMFITSCPHVDNLTCCCSVPFDATPDIYFEAKEFFQNKGFDLLLKRTSPVGCRLRSKLAVRKGCFGLFRKGSHDVVEIPHCIVHHPSINQAVAYVKEAIGTAHLSSYDENSHSGDLRYIQCSTERQSGKVQVVFVLNSDENNALLIQIWRAFCEQLFQKSTLFHSFWLNFQPYKTNTIFGQQWLHIIGPEVLWQHIYNHDIAFGPSHFSQANVGLMEVLLGDLVGSIPQGANVVELYGGVGVIGLSLPEKVASCTIIEREKNTDYYFTLSKERLPESLRSKFSFHVSDANKAAAYSSHHDTIIVDPPRKGLDIRVRELVSSFTRIVYVSCNFRTLARDIELLEQQGFTIQEAKSYYFFPGTNHIELLVILEKQSG